MIAADACPQLAPKARLRFDRKTERYMLLYPEHGLLLNATASDVLRLCTGAHTVEAIVDELVARYVTQPRATVEREVGEFLDTMISRGLVR